MAEDIKNIQDEEAANVSGGGTGWPYANGRYEDYGSYIIYIVAPNDVLSGIAVRFGVTVDQIAQWNGIPNPDRINIGQRLTIYPRRK